MKRDLNYTCHISVKNVGLKNILFIIRKIQDDKGQVPVYSVYVMIS